MKPLIALLLVLAAQCDLCAGVIGWRGFRRVETWTLDEGTGRFRKSHLIKTVFWTSEVTWRTEVQHIEVTYLPNGWVQWRVYNMDRGSIVDMPSFYADYCAEFWLKDIRRGPSLTEPGWQTVRAPLRVRDPINGLGAWTVRPDNRTVQKVNTAVTTAVLNPYDGETHWQRLIHDAPLWAMDEWEYFEVPGKSWRLFGNNIEAPGNPGVMYNVIRRDDRWK